MPVSGWLAFYATHFPTVEINSTFYRLPSPEILRRWRNATPDHFRFTAKASRFITHMKKLATPEIHAARFLDGISELGEKLATVLYQLPTFWEFDRRRLINFTQFLSRQNLIPGLRFTVEFHNPSWLVPDAFEILRDNRIALVHSDPRGLSIPRTFTADFFYLRRHGSPTPGRIDYTNRELESDARWIQRESRLHTRHPLLLQQRPAGRGDSRCHAADPKNPNKKVATPIPGTLDSPLLFQEP